jgi:serine phosphatase RsbU (regulator of sigma subunit)
MYIYLKNFLKMSVRTMVSLRFYLYIGNTLMVFVDREKISDDLKERALAAAGEGITIADARRLAEDRLAAAYRDMQRDLEAAARIQQSLLPGSIPAISGVDIAWSYRPSEELGGDTLNIIRLDDTTIALYLLDVSGHRRFK